MKKHCQFDKELQSWESNDSLICKNNKLLQKIHQNAKKNSLTQKSIDKHKSRPSSSPVRHIEINKSLNQLRFIGHQQQQQSTKIKNRLQYLNISTDRQQKLINSARLKFNKINQIRRQSFTDKSFFENQRKNLLYQQQKTAYLKASKIKNQRHRISESQEKLKFEKHHLVQNAKKQRSLNESFIKQQKQRNLSICSQKVLKIHQQQQIQKQKSKIRTKKKIQQGVLNHRKQIFTQYQKVQQQLKANEKMMKNFQRKASKIFDKKTKQQQELQHFKDFLGLNKSEIKFKNLKTPLSNQLQKTLKFEQNKKVTQSASSTKNPNSTYFRRTSLEKEMYLTNPQQQINRI